MNSDARPTPAITPGHAALATCMIGLGVMALGTGDFSQIWQPLPKWVPARETLVYVTALISLGTGAALFWPRAARTAAGALAAAWMAWLVVMRLPNLFYESPLVLVGWTFGATAVMAGGTWALYARLARRGAEANRNWLTSDASLRVARALFGVSLIPFGLAHFMYLENTTVLIPAWIPWHTAWAYFTGSAFIAAGLATMTGVLGRIAAWLVACQMLGFILIIWIPRTISGALSDFQRGEVVSSLVLLAGAVLVAESYGD